MEGFNGSTLLQEVHQYIITAETFMNLYHKIIGMILQNRESIAVDIGGFFL